jgi:HupE / UreJ protein
VRLFFLLFAFSIAAPGHDIPNDVTVQMFLKPAGDRLQLLVRVPVAALRDINFPEHASGYMDLARSRELLADAAIQWIADAIEIQEDGTSLPRPRVGRTQLSLLSDKSFASFEEALANTMGAPLPDATNVFWNQTMLDVLFEYPILSDRSRFSIHPGVARLGLRVVTVLRFLPPGGVIRAFEFTGDPGLVRLDPRWYQAALRFVQLGFFHILDGTDHLLFLFCLVIPFRRLWALVPVVTAFTAAHSITLIASAFGWAPGALWFPPLIEALIAASIVWMALENIVGTGSLRRRWIMAFGFGLVHGFGFSFALRETLQFAGTHLLTSLLSFNVGVELGQLLVLALLIPALQLLFRFVVAERMGTIILSALVAHTGWHWMVERWDRFRQFHVARPEFTTQSLVLVTRWLTLGVVVAGLVWLVARLVRHGSVRQNAGPG